MMVWAARGVLFSAFNPRKSGIRGLSNLNATHTAAVYARRLAFDCSAGYPMGAGVIN